MNDIEILPEPKNQTDEMLKDIINHTSNTNHSPRETSDTITPSNQLQSVSRDTSYGFKMKYEREKITAEDILEDLE